MKQILQDKIRKWLREASNEGTRGFYFDSDLSEEEQSENWVDFENMAMSDIVAFEEFLK